MNHLKSKTIESVNILLEYFEAKWNVAALNISDRAAQTISSILMGLCLAFVGFFVVILLSIAAAIALGQWVNNMALGFLMVAAIYLVISLLLIWFRKALLFLPFVNYILKILYKGESNGN
jgi:hypothetical protein